MEKLEYKGKVYTKGAIYEFSDNGNQWFKEGLTDFQGDCSLPRPIVGERCVWKYIRECEAPLGTIEDKPVDLINGGYYSFEYSGETYVGEYDGVFGFVIRSREAAVFIIQSECTNIKRLIEE